MAESNPIPTAHCRGCGYLLRGLASSGACPECGRAFDLADRKTWARHPPRRIWRRIRWPLAFLMLLVLSCGSGIGWLYWGWRREQPAIKWMSDGSVEVRQIGPQWLKERAGRWGWLLERANSIAVRLDQSPEARELAERLKWLERVTVEGPGLTEEWVAELGEGNELRELWLGWEASLEPTIEPLNDAFLTRLGQQRKLESLHFYGVESAVTDAGLAALAGFPELRDLQLRGSLIEGPGLQHLRHVPKLERLNLGATMVGDDAMSEVGKCAELRHLLLQGTRVTSRGVRELAGLKKLESLDLSHMQVDESVVDTLSKMRSLRAVHLRGSPSLSQEQLQQLRAALPVVLEIKPPHH